ncbi:XdhC family protein [Danxiaibacter flavus]|uniref:XdhC family protein n=1 Tax=Danxiaibacter flavus TaxID=3049108 RepID=A0ABV3ZGA7_9BACT|nr:XdhC family protein [Chitinophagaceae bacterium DXS]
MKELNDIVAAYDRAVLQKKQTALVSVVKVDGSSYRRPGARMLVTEDGEITGAISGGCLEGDALRKAQLAMFEKRNKLEIYDTTDDEDNKLGIQLGCNGIVYILFEPLQIHDPHNPLNLLKRVAHSRKDAVIATIFNEDKRLHQQGTVCLVNENETIALYADADLQADASVVLGSKNSSVKNYGDHTALFQFVPPSIQLVVAGAGNDTQPLTEMAYILGWNIVIVDGRPAHATQQRFPKAGKVCVAKPQEILSAVNVDEESAFVLMTHNYNYDLAVLEQIMRTNCSYIGVLGPKKKLQKMFDELVEKGTTISEDALQKIYGPVGLDIGAETSEEIALSVIAEIKAVFSGRNGTSLRERKVEIHARPIM